MRCNLKRKGLVQNETVECMLSHPSRDETARWMGHPFHSRSRLFRTLLSLSSQVVLPGVAPALQEVVGAFGAPGAGEIVREDFGGFVGPGVDDGRVEGPVDFHA